jgi:adenylate cyclase
VRRQLVQGALLGFAAALLALLLWSAGILTPLENLTWQWRAGSFAGEPPKTPIVLVALDQASLDWGRKENALSWPWPREAYRLIVDFCRRAGARAIAFDLLFSEDSVYGVEDDQALAAALGQVPAVGAVSLSRRSGPDSWPVNLNPSRMVVEQWPTRAKPYASGTFPVAGLGQAFHGLGNVSAQPDADGIYRRIPLLDRLQHLPVPSLALALLLAADPKLPVELAGERLVVGNQVVPLDLQGNAILRFRGPAGTFPTLSAAAVIQSELRMKAGEPPVVDPARLQEAYVIFGLIAPGLYDLRATPLAGVFPGMEIQATVLDNLLSGGFLRDVPVHWTILLTVFIALVAGVAVRSAVHIWQALLAAMIVLPLLLALGFGAYRAGWWLPMAPPLIALAGAMTLAMLMNYVTEGRQRRFIKQAFNQYLHPIVIDQLLAHPDRLRLGGERREITVFFSDLQGFSGFSEQLDPETLTTLLNEYLTAMTDIILDNGGTVDKYVGDAILAFWNAPLDQPDHAARAFRTAQLCQARLAELRPQLYALAGQDLHMRIGINTGTAVVGNMGSQRRFDYTVLGDAVNLASRLEGVNKEFGTFTLLAESTRCRLDRHFTVREIARVGVVGRTEPVRIYEPLEATVADDPRAAAFAAALARYYAGEFQEAGEEFTLLAGGDSVARRYAERCRELTSAPPSAWDGVWRMNSK